MHVIGPDGVTRDYAYAAIGDVLVPLVAGSRLERLFFRVVDVSKVPREVKRYERPPVEAYGVAQSSGNGGTGNWGDDESDDEWAPEAARNAEVVRGWMERRTAAVKSWLEDYATNHKAVDVDPQSDVSFVARP